jgi:hypothetical protein
MYALKPSSGAQLPNTADPRLTLPSINMRKKNNNFATSSVSFDDFEQAMLSQASNSTPLDELVKDRLSAEKEARKKETELKKAYKVAKRSKKL